MIRMIPKSIILILIIGILASYYNFGFLSVFFSVSLPVLFLLNVVCVLIGLFTKKYIYSLGVLLFVVFFDFFFQINSKNKPNSYSNENTLNILSYNVRDFNKDYDIDDTDIAAKIVDFINTTNSDVLLLQESSYKESRGIENYPYQFLGYREGIEKSLLAIYSKHPIINTGYVDFPNTMNNCIYADIKFKNDTIRIFNLHLQSFQIQMASLKNNILKKVNGGFSKQIQQAHLVKAEVDTSSAKVVIGGDFNTTQFALPYRVLKQDLNDSFIAKGNGLGTTYSLLFYPLRLDHFLIDKRIEIVGHENFNLNLSDHEPILTTLLIE